MNKRVDNQLLGLLLFLINLVVMVAISSLVKIESEHVPLPVILFFRFAIALLPLIIIARWKQGKIDLTTSRPWDHIIRSASGIFALSMFFLAISLIPLADATAISYCSPLFITILAIPLLAEKVGWRRWSAVLVGMVGMLIIANPTGAEFSIGTLAAVLSAIFAAVVVIWLRRMSDTEDTSTIAIFYNFSGAVLFLAWWFVADYDGIPVASYPSLIALGLLAGVQQFCFAASFRYAEASFLAPFEYTVLILAAATGYFLWQEIPTLQTWIGAAIIVASGLIIAKRESVKVAA